MYAIYQASQLADAELLLHKLADHGIHAVVRNGFLQGALGELPANLRPEVCVLAQQDIETARNLALEFDAELRAPSENEEWLCERCGELSPDNFEVCWQCRSPRPHS